MNVETGHPVRESNESPDSLQGVRVAFVGRLGGVSRREAQRLVRQHGGTPVEPSDRPLDLVVLGGEELPWGTGPNLLSDALQDEAASGKLQVISETQFWQRLGLVENEQAVRRLYTPAMLADLLKVPVAVIRRWHRRGLIVPTREVHRLPYFSFQEVATARRLAELIAAGAKPAEIERQLEQLARLVPDVERPLAQLSIIVEGRDLLLRQGEGLIEAGGQMRLDFDHPSVESPRHGDQEGQSTGVLPLSHWTSQASNAESNVPSYDEITSVAADLEDEGRIDEAMEMYRVALVAAGPSAEVCFRLAELLYLSGDVSAARERYAMAIELDEDYVEARANLGCVLAELGQWDLAIAAFEGALQSHPDYPDVHYHLARLLDEHGAKEEADHYWSRFIDLAPDSPWADEARMRLDPQI